MFRFLSSFYNNYIKACFSFFEEEPDKSHKNKIHKAGLLARNTKLPIAVRADAVRDIGIFGFQGRYTLAAQTGDEYMASMVEILRTPDVKELHIIRVLEGLSAICYVHIANQNKAKALGLPDTLLEFLSPNSKLPITPQRWTCYLFLILCYKNIALIRQLKKCKTLRSSLEKLVSLDWENWPSNYAQRLYRVLGFHLSSNDVHKSS